MLFIFALSLESWFTKDKLLAWSALGTWFYQCGQSIPLQRNKNQLWNGIDFEITYTLEPVTLSGFPGGSVVKKPPANAGDTGLIPGLGRPPRGGHGDPILSFLPGKSHGERSLAGSSPWGHKEQDMTSWLNNYNMMLCSTRKLRLAGDRSRMAWVSWRHGSELPLEGVIQQRRRTSHYFLWPKLPWWPPSLSLLFSIHQKHITKPNPLFQHPYHISENILHHCHIQNFPWFPFTVPINVFSIDDQMKVKVAQLCLTLCNPMDSVHGILQARILEWAAFPFSRGSSQ